MKLVQQAVVAFLFSVLNILVHKEHNFERGERSRRRARDARAEWSVPQPRALPSDLSLLTQTTPHTSLVRAPPTPSLPPLTSPQPHQHVLLLRQPRSFLHERGSRPSAPRRSRDGARSRLGPVQPDRLELPRQVHQYAVRRTRVEQGRGSLR